MADINIRSTYFSAQYERNRLIRDLFKGLDALRGATLLSSSFPESVYLPRFPDEPPEIYTQRVRRSYLTNYFARAIDSDSGKILAKTIGIKSDGEDLPEQFHPWLDDVDLEGKALSVLARDQLQEALGKGVTLAFVDHTAAGNGRPFVREIDIDNVLAFRADGTTGKLTFLRWQDSIPEDSEDDGVVSCDVVFEITPTEWKMFRDEEGSVSDEPDDQGNIVRYRNGSQLITDELPVSIFYTNKTGKLRAESAYRTLAELTLEHFQVYSDMKNMLFYALQPILFTKNGPDDLEMRAIASYLHVNIPENASSKDPSMEWVQVNPGSIQEARKQLEDIQIRIASFSIDNAAIRPGNQTATQSAIDASGAHAALRSFSSGLAEHLERIIEFMASYTLQPEMDIDVTINPDFNVKDDIEDIKLLQEDVDKGRLSVYTYWDMLIERRILPEDFDKESEFERLEQERAVSAFDVTPNAE